jgi:lipopolysaccharide/colanic/teichoic acid biosynthesis glycosyltransferase
MYVYIKRAVDLTAAFILLVLTSPLVILAALSIKLDSPGTVLFKQYRAGKNERIFQIYKLRTMYIDKKEAVTRVGNILRKLSIDELPQLVNIIKGDMSFIGPRPLLISYLELYSSTQRRRHEVLPGISGLAQVNGRNSIDWCERFKLDVWYVDHMSIFLDIKIALKTIYGVVFARGVNRGNDIIMPPFEGNNDQDSCLLKKP